MRSLSPRREPANIINIFWEKPKGPSFIQNNSKRKSKFNGLLLSIILLSGNFLQSDFGAEEVFLLNIRMVKYRHFTFLRCIKNNRNDFYVLLHTNTTRHYSPKFHSFKAFAIHIKRRSNSSVFI